VELGPSKTLNDLFNELDVRGVQVVSLRNKANRLEELFMRLVENKQRDDREVLEA
jgi:ABC-2 type transport system ATP-binding protein